MSIRQAIIDKLKTGTIARVYNRSSEVLSPDTPYVVIWQEKPTVQNSIQQGLGNWRIACHYSVGEIEDLEKYIEIEVYELLHKKKLTNEPSGDVFDCYVTKEISPAVNNTDGSISKDILIQVPAP